MWRMRLCWRRTLCSSPASAALRVGTLKDPEVRDATGQNPEEDVSKPGEVLLVLHPIGDCLSGNPPRFPVIVHPSIPVSRTVSPHVEEHVASLLREAVLDRLRSGMDTDAADEGADHGKGPVV